MTFNQRYTDLESAGSNRIGDLFNARHAVLGRPARICRIHDTLADRDAVIERLREVAQLHHPNIAAVIDADFDADAPYFITDGDEGETLRARLDSGPLPREDALRAVRDLFRGLLFAHEHDLAHGALGPSRLHIGSSGTLRISDFGMHAAKADPTGATVAIDTDSMPYLPLHVLRNPDAYDEATDFHCAAAIALHLLTGDIVEGPPPSTLDGLSDGAVAALHALMSRDASRDTLRDALATFEGATSPAEAPRAAVESNPPKPSDADSAAAALAPTGVVPELHRSAPGRRHASSGTMVMTSPVAIDESGAHPAAVSRAPQTGAEGSVQTTTSALERFAGMPNTGGATLLENPYDDPSQSVLDALGGAIDEPDGEPAPVDPGEQTQERETALHDATARAREARERAQEAMARYASLMSS